MSILPEIMDLKRCNNSYFGIEFCNSKDPCTHSCIGWEQLWLYWILRKWGLPKDIILYILNNFQYYYSAIWGTFQNTKVVEPLFKLLKIGLKRRKLQQPCDLFLLTH